MLIHGKDATAVQVRAPFRDSELEAVSKGSRKIDREIFDEMIDGSTHYWSAASNAPRPFLFESLLMSIIFAHQAKLERMRKDVAGLEDKARSARFSGKPGDQVLLFTPAGVVDDDEVEGARGLFYPESGGATKTEDSTPRSEG